MTLRYLRFIVFRRIRAVSTGLGKIKEMKRLKHILLAFAALLGITALTGAKSSETPRLDSSNGILDRVAKIQAEADKRDASRNIFDDLKITQWNNWPNWPDWNDWNNWNNWYNY